MITRARNVVLGISIAIVISGAAFPVAIATYEPTTITTYIHGSENVPHDVEHGELVNSAVKYGTYCSEDASELIFANRGDVAISMRVNSYECSYTSTSFDIIPIVGWDNEDRFVGDVKTPNSIAIGNGLNYGHAIDYYIDVFSLSQAMPMMANITIDVNNARVRAGMSMLTLSEMKLVLDQSSDQVLEVDGKYYGQIIDVERAIVIATKEVTIDPCPICGVMSAINTLLLL